jgi:hypothetical protein
MKTESYLLKFDGRQRWCWLSADRATLIIVGSLWLALIVRVLLTQRTPYELILVSP